MDLCLPCQTGSVDEFLLPPPPPAPSAPANRLSLTTRLTLVAFATAFVASLLPWVRVLFVSINGTDGDGRITLVTAAVGFGCVVAVGRVTRRHLLLQACAVLSATLTCLVFVYNLADVSRTAGDAANDIFDLQVSPQFGLLVGAVAAPVSLLTTIIGFGALVRTRTGGSPRPWTGPDLLAASLAVSALPFALSPSLWAMSLVLVFALSAVLWFGTRRSRIHTTCSVVVVIGLIVAAGGTVYGLVDDGGGTSMSADMRNSLQGLPVEDLSECREVYRSGTSTAEIDEPILCLDGNVETYVFPITWECEDGRTLVSNEYGWGYVDESWSTVGEAPFDRCRSTAQQSCAEIFVAGATTLEEWADDYLECFDADGEIDYVITSRWDCFDSDEVQLSNRYGWGYVGQPWISGEDSPFC